jgi:hypothetical protein
VQLVTNGGPHCGLERSVGAPLRFARLARDRDDFVQEIERVIEESARNRAQAIRGRVLVEFLEHTRFDGSRNHSQLPRRIPDRLQRARVVHAC